MSRRVFQNTEPVREDAETESDDAVQFAFQDPAMYERHAAGLGEMNWFAIALGISNFPVRSQFAPGNPSSPRSVHMVPSQWNTVVPSVVPTLGRLIAAIAHTSAQRKLYAPALSLTYFNSL